MINSTLRTYSFNLGIYTESNHTSEWIRIINILRGVRGMWYTRIFILKFTVDPFVSFQFDSFMLTQFWQTHKYMRLILIQRCHKTAPRGFRMLIVLAVETYDTPKEYSINYCEFAKFPEPSLVIFTFRHTYMRLA